MHHQRRRFEIRREQMRRPLPVQLAVRIRRPLELPFREPQLLGCAPLRLGVEHPVVRDQALEPVCVPQNPVHHVSAVARSQRALAIFVNERILLLGIVESLHKIFKRSAAPNRR